MKKILAAASALVMSCATAHELKFIDNSQESASLWVCTFDEKAKDKFLCMSVETFMQRYGQTRGGRGSSTTEL